MFPPNIVNVIVDAARAPDEEKLSKNQPETSRNSQTSSTEVAFVNSCCKELLSKAIVRECDPSMCEQSRSSGGSDSLKRRGGILKSVLTFIKAINPRVIIPEELVESSSDVRGQEENDEASNSNTRNSTNNADDPRITAKDMSFNSANTSDPREKRRDFVPVRMKNTRSQSSVHFNFMRLCLALAFSSVLFTILIFLFVFIPFAKISMGMKFFENCPAQPLIPLFLVVDGILVLFAYVFLMVVKYCYTARYTFQHRSKIMACFILYCMMELIVLIGGTFIIFTTTVQSDVEDEPTFCNQRLYEFSRWVVVASWVLLGMSLIAVLLLYSVFYYLGDSQVKGDMEERHRLVVTSKPQEHNNISAEGPAVLLETA